MNSSQNGSSLGSPIRRMQLFAASPCPVNLAAAKKWTTGWRRSNANLILGPRECAKSIDMTIQDTTPWRTFSTKTAK
jgi:hypothetical protein